VPVESKPAESGAVPAALAEALVQSSVDGLLAFDRECRYTLWNPAMERFTGMAASRVLGRNAFECFPHLVPIGVDRLFFSALAGETTVVENYETVGDQGKRFYDRHYAPLFDGSGNVIGGVGVVRDVTARRLAEEALREREELFRSVVENATDAIGIVDREGRGVYANPAMEQILGYGKGGLAGKSVLEHAHPDDVARATEGLLRVVSDVGSSVAIDARWRHTDGTWRTLDGRASAFVDREGAVRVVFHARDVTAVRVAQKMEAIGRLAGGVAHDFNNLLTIILSCTDLLARRAATSGESSSSAYVAEIAGAAERGAALTRQLLTFSSMQPVQARPMDLNAVVVEAQAMLERLIGEHIALSAELDPDAGCVRADPGQIEQVILNLVLNARDAIGARGGRIRLSTKVAEVRGEDTRYAAIQVEDDGAGMSDHVKAHLFEPFFTTKPRGQGTGLGLATVYGIVQQTSGRLTVRSAPGVGTTIEVLLPATDSAPPPRLASSPAREDSRGEETILLVEDEAPLRRVIRDVLTESGYEVVEAADGHEATRTIAQLADEGRGVDLVLSDVVMPGPSGRQLAAAVREKWPGARVLLMSGYDDDATRDCTEQILGKPFTAAALARRVRDVLGAVRSGGA
jgi:two-component system cell cycle sensor histidine kinase/response regulator CckA